MAAVLNRLLTAVAAVSLYSCATPAQLQNLQPADMRQTAERRGPSLTALEQGINDEEMRRDLAMSALDIAVHVRGGIAETILTATFANPGEDTLEGRFALNMARGAAITGYALDVDGEMIDGVLETRYAAAEAYQSRVNRRIDPGLAEVDYSDRFETRVYPIPARGERTIRLKMVSQFDPDAGYALPLTVAGPVGRFTLRIVGDARIVGMPSGLRRAQSSEASDIVLKGELRLAAAPRPDVLVSSHPGANDFFDITGALPRGAIDRNRPLHILWDRSLSRIDDQLEAEAGLAEALALKRGLRRAMLTLFDSGRIETREVAADRIAETLSDVRYRGATSYAALSPLAVAPGADCLMFSDGRVTIDDRKDFLPACAVTAITSGPERDAAWLADLAQRTGGAFHTLTRSNSEDVFRLLDRPDASLLSVTDGKGAPIDFATLASDRRSFHIVGPAPADGVVLVSIEGEAAPRRFDIRNAPEQYFSGPGALWARHRLGVIEAETKPEDLAAMARRYSIATPQASFIVLETPEDYVEANIAPPATYPKLLKAAYADLREEADADLRESRESRLADVVYLWEQQQAWWERDFDGPPPRKDRPMQPTAAPAPAEASAPEETPLDFARAVTLAAPEEAGAGADSATYFSPSLGGDEGGGRDVVVLTASRRTDSDEAEGASSSRAGSISVAGWTPDRPYLKKLDEAGDGWERVIDAELTSSGALPLFWFDVAEWHWRKGRKDEARRAVESALDLPTRNNETLAIVAARLSRYGAHDRAVWLLERLAEREESRPQPKRTLALALLDRAKAQPAAAKADIARAIDLLVAVATGIYRQEPEGIETVALMEANAALAKLKAMGGTSDALDPRLVALLDADLRVVMEWNTPRTDLDLWVLEPKGYDVGYDSPLSPWGGKLSGDITDGYGPEEYLVRRALAGEYMIRANTFASDPANPNGPSRLSIRLIRNFGRPDQSEEMMDIEMDAESREKSELGRIRIE